MKTILKQLFFVLTLAMLTSAVDAQTTPDPCEAGNEVYREWSEVHYPKKDEAGRKEAIEKGKQYVEKFGKCADQAEFIKFVSDNLPIMEKNYNSVVNRRRRGEFIAKFESNLNKNWDEVYAAGKALLAEWPDDMRDVKLAMGTFGYDETRKTPSNTKWNEDTIKYAKESIADLEAGKTFKNFGVAPSWKYKGKDDAIGWMHYNIGYINSFAKNNLKEGAMHMFKVSQMNVDATKDAAVYGALTKYYIPLLNGEVKKLQELPVPADTEPEETGKPKADAIKAQTAVIRGLAERIMETLGQTYARIDNTPAQKTFKDGIMNQFKEVYGTRFNTKDTAAASGMIASYGSRTVADPSAPITPIVEEPTAAASAPATTPGTTTMKPATPAAKPVAPAAKPAGTGPAAKPMAGTGTKPGVAKIKKPAKR